MTVAPRSKEFDDVYFSAIDGLSETRHVFLQGNNLPCGWEGMPVFTIFETGFGTGLNFLAVSRLFLDNALPGQKLHFISVEKYPLAKADIEQFLSPWKNEFSHLWSLFLDLYPAKFSKINHIQITEAIALTLYIGDVNEIISDIQDKIDCWFLDGFKPSSNPEMWSEMVFKNMARLSKPGATFATFTAAGFVKRGLRASGFEVQKVPGFGTKRDMLVGCFP